MSYNYDYNPWNDNYNTGQQQQQQPNSNVHATTGYGVGGYSSDGYSNPMNQYSSGNEFDVNQQQQQQYPYQTDQQYNDVTQGQQEPTSEQMAQQQQQLPQPPQEPTQERSFVSRFLRQRVPLIGRFMDTMSGINLPFIDALVQHVNRDLLVSKMFYFFFYSAFGSLFPLMGVYFKQLGMNPAQVGILTGVRPFIEIFSAPFWNSLAERFHKSKALLLFSVLSWIIFTHSLAHIRPPASACVAFNDTDYVLYIPYSTDDLSNYDVGGTEEEENNSSPATTTTTTSKRVENEMFMSKMPPSDMQPELSTKETEVKGEILASEENQNDQRRRRRRKRNVESSSFTLIDHKLPIDEADKKMRYLYRVEGDENRNPKETIGDDDLGYESQLDLSIDLENDFDDKLIKQESKQRKIHHGGAWSAFVELENELAGDDSTKGDEFEQLYSKGASARYKRAAKKGKKVDADMDDLFGETNESTNNESVDENEEKDDEGEQEQEKPEREKLKERKENENDEDDENNIEEEEREETEETNNNNNKKPKQQNRGSNKYRKQQQAKSGTITTNNPTTTTTTTTTTAMPQASGDFMQQQEPNFALPNGSVGQVNKTKKIYKQRHKTPPTHIVGMSPITVEYAVNYNKDKHKQFVTPMFSTIVYKLDDIKEVFFLLLLLISLGEFFSAPALTLADSATLSYLGENTDLYGRQRMFGSLSWAITLLLVGMALDNATSITDHPCGPHQRERSYTVCFNIFSLLMACAFLTASQFRFSYPKSVSSSSGVNAANGSNTMVMASTTNNNGNTIVTTTVDGDIDQLYASTQPRSIFNTAPPVNAPPPSSLANNQQDGATKDKFEFLDKWKSAVFAQRTGELPEWINVFRQFRNSLHLMYLFITWFLGCGVGLVFTFLFWHLQDVGGTPTLFGICSVINHISEILAYFFSFSFIKRFGHTRVLSVGLGCNVIRFLYVAFLTNPYYALPFELVQGITHAACFAACCSYISHVSKPELRTSTQGVMQGLHHGIGRACGALLGGYMINAIGSRASFCIYGLLSGCVLAGFLYIRKKASELEDEEVKVDESEALGGYGAPQGVPSAIPGKIGQNAPAQDIDYKW